MADKKGGRPERAARQAEARSNRKAEKLELGDTAHELEPGRPGARHDMRPARK